MAEDLDEKARRVRELLSSFYKSDESDSGDFDLDAPGDGGVSARRRDTLLQINTKGFEPERYMASLVRKTNLPTLLKKHVEVAAEIKNLDSDMQMLVYENYNKFISATDTIKVMKDNVAGMESNMQQLLEKVTAVRTKSDNINASLFERRGRIEELNGTRSLLRKVQFVFDLPKRLRKCLKEGDYAQAVKFYVGASPVLETYGSSSFRTCKQESEEVIATISKRLQAKFLADSEPLPGRAEAVALLQQLKFPVDVLMDGFLTSNMKHLLELQTLSHKSKSPDDAKKFITEFTQTATAFRSIFPTGESRLNEAAKDLLDKYFANVNVSLQPEAGSLSAAELISLLKSLSADVAKMHEVMPEAGFIDGAIQAVESAVKQHVNHKFKVLYAQVTGALSDIHSPKQEQAKDQQKPLLLSLENVQNLIVNGGLEVLKDLTQLLDDSVDFLVSWRDAYIDLVQGGFQEFFGSLVDHFISLSLASATQGEGSDQRLGSPAPGFVLLLSRLSTFIEQEGVPRITEAVGDSFIGGSLGDRPAFLPSEICRAFRAAAEKFLRQFIDVRSRKLSIMICKSITTPNWLQYKEPRDVRMFADLLLDEVKGMEGEVKQVLEPGKSHRRSDSAGSSSSTRSSNTTRGDSRSSRLNNRGKTHLLERDVAKLFKQRVEIFTRPELTQASVISMVVKIALKSFQEYVRLETFSRCGFQQIQLDTQYLRDPLREVVDDDNVVDFLLDEVCAAAAERCTDPTPLEQAVLDKIVHTKREKRLDDEATKVFI
ncbi:hypothetical protein SELMODRAFT_440937 [Selaginella moellendorffii]|uniref:Vacuolar protein sorting-associated protein 51 homolog n=1 Tax=Selaginella moellendorffii TaxID=88036 RepID=D8RFI7_SELML|nr:vacuolar protein sorting-associated protein 51 homolog [Selaginella moellendorffii]EFJ29128.1 hypothetical protein SELMODRAFT_440937 [Selaginella moellendorffii]|eukprot:XP_002970004.1 vacuolar protein sorting-associated protein 51 homolog [Selaginella moellendorffii]